MDSVSSERVSGFYLAERWVVEKLQRSMPGPDVDGQPPRKGTNGRSPHVPLVFAWLVYALYNICPVRGSQCQKVTVGKIPRVALDALHLPHNWKFASGQAPYILTSLPYELFNATQWGESTLRASFGPYDVGAYWRNMRDPGAHRLDTTSMENLLENLSRKTKPFYGFWAGIPAAPAAQIFPQMPASMPDVFNDSFEPWKACLTTEHFQFDFDFKSKWRMVLIGNKGSGMFMHQDYLGTASWQIQTSGSKHWALCNPADGMSTHMDEHTAFSLLNSTIRRRLLRHGTNCDEEDRGGNERTPIRCALGTVSAGEAIFYPAHVWHETLNGPGISVAATATVVQPAHTYEVQERQQRVCRGEIDFDRPTEAVCAALDGCYEWWHQGLGGQYATQTEDFCS